MLNKDGYEIPDPVPLARHFSIQAEETLADKIKRMVRFELSQQVKEVAETWEEADDFDVGDDPELSSPYELSDDTYEGTYEQAIAKVEAPVVNEPAGSPAPGDAAPVASDGGS